MTGPDYNALQPRRNAYNRKVDPYKLSGTELQGYVARLTRLSGTLKCTRIEPKTSGLVQSSREYYKFVVKFTIRLQSGIKNFPRPLIYLVFRSTLQHHYLYSLDRISYHF
jgi:hypothetical protein